MTLQINKNSNHIEIKLNCEYNMFSIDSLIVTRQEYWQFFSAHKLQQN